MNYILEHQLFKIWNKKKQREREKLYLLMDTSITMEIRQTVADVMPVRGNAPVLVSGVGIHRNVIKGVRPTQPVEENNK